MTAHPNDPRVFKPEEEEARIRDDVIRGYINPDGTLRAHVAAVPSSGAATFITVLVPLIMVVVAAAMWIGGFAGYAPTFRAILERVLPDGWVAASVQEQGNPLAVGIALGVVLLIVLIGLFLARRAVVRPWTRNRGGIAFLLSLGVFVISALMTLVCILAPGFLLVGTSIATGADLSSTPLPEGATVRSWPLILTAATMAWMGLVATRRTGRRRRSHR